MCVFFNRKSKMCVDCLSWVTASMEEGLPGNVAAYNNEELHGIRRSKRNEPPGHYTLKIESFSQLSTLLKKTGAEKYESDAFESGGYKWKLVLYPCGNVKRDEHDHISLYLAPAEPNAIRRGSQVDVILKFFVYDHLRDEFLTIQDDKMSRYHSLKTENGFDQLLSLRSFNDFSNGYLVDDCCVLGVEVYVVKYEGKGERLSIMKVPDYGSFTWKIQSFSVYSSCLYSSEFTAAKHKWRLSLYPTGDSRASGKSLSLFLELLSSSADPQLRLYTEYKLIVKDQLHENHREREGSRWFMNKSGSSSWGYSEFMSLDEIYNQSKGYLVNNVLIVEAKVSVFADIEGLS